RATEQAHRAAEIIRQMTGGPVVCGHELSPRLDAVKRAATTILNAHLIPVIHHLIDSVKRVFLRNRITAPLMIVRGDGSLMGAPAIMNRPIETILSGPAASVIGARFLLGQEGAVEDAVIVDIGGTTTDMALLRNRSTCTGSKPVAMSAVSSGIIVFPRRREAIMSGFRFP
ncbi:MAG: hydantoinase/oxoprolinase family protein, partial [Thermodesulfobacteriota bacterium]